MSLDELTRRVTRLHKQLEEENKVRLEQNQRLDTQARRARSAASRRR